jgi:hypothetical protein
MHKIALVAIVAVVIGYLGLQAYGAFASIMTQSQQRVEMLTSVK